MNYLAPPSEYAKYESPLVGRLEHTRDTNYALGHGSPNATGNSSRFDGDTRTHASEIASARTNSQFTGGYDSYATGHYRTGHKPMRRPANAWTSSNMESVTQLNNAGMSIQVRLPPQTQGVRAPVPVNAAEIFEFYTPPSSSSLATLPFSADLSFQLLVPPPNPTTCAPPPMLHWTTHSQQFSMSMGPAARYSAGDHTSLNDHMVFGDTRSWSHSRPFPGTTLHDSLPYGEPTSAAIICQPDSGRRILAPTERHSRTSFA